MHLQHTAHEQVAVCIKTADYYKLRAFVDYSAVSAHMHNLDCKGDCCVPYAEVEVASERRNPFNGDIRTLSYSCALPACWPFEFIVSL